MEGLLKKYYALLVLLLVVPIVAVLVQYGFYHSILEQKSRNLAVERMLGAEQKLAAWLDARRQNIRLASLAASKYPNDALALRAGLQTILQSDPYFRSLYYVTRENKMVNATDFVPPPTLDFRLRPWYVKAAEKGGLVLTDVFLNASRDDYIVTVAMPVYGASAELLGVVGGDISLSTIVALIENTYITSRSHVFLADGAQLMAFSRLSHGFSLEQAQTTYQWLVNAFPNTSRGITLTHVGDHGGYFARWQVSGTNWVLSAFVPAADLATDTAMLCAVIAGLLASLAAMAALFVFIQQRYVVRPLMRLAEDIGRIDVERTPSYRLPTTNMYETARVVGILNGLLARLESYLHHVRESELARRELNASLETAMQHATEHHHEISRQHEYWKALFANSQDAIVLLDGHNCILETNEAFSLLFGYSPAEARGSHLEGLLATHKLEEANALTLSMMQGLTCGLESTRLHKDGRQIEVEIKGVPVHIGEHYVGGYGIYSDISMRKENERKIIRMSHYDQLTNVYNRAYFDHVFAELTAHGPWPVSLIMGDTNGLKVVNDAFGHGMGDEILKRTARVLALEARPQDTVARLGGDEFAMLLPGVDENEAMAICARIRERCQAGSDTTIHLSLALGASTAHDRQRKEVLFTAAEERMYHQKLLEGKSIRNSLIASLRQALQEKTHETTEHSMRMTDLSLRLAAKLELSPSMRDDIEVFASIHDLGKIAIPEQILEKCGPLTAEEWSIMQKHSEIGFRIASTSPELSHIAECILHHHERWDGTGYPQGLRGEAICLRSRVVAVVDAYDAMTSDRPYRRALGRELALAEIEKGRGRQFDPRVADAFLALMHSSAEYEPTGQGED